MNEKIHDILYDFLQGKIPVQEITHAANEICKEPTEEKIQEMQVYLMQFDKEFVAMQTINTKALPNNDVRFAMSEVRKVVEAENEKKKQPTPVPTPSEEEEKNEGGES